MRRLLVLALGLSALLWTADARTGSAPPDDITSISGAGSSRLASHSHEPSDSDRQWLTQQRTIAAVTESVWKSTLVHAALAATRTVSTFDAARAVSSPDPPVGSAPHYLRHTPLLI